MMKATRDAVIRAASESPLMGREWLDRGVAPPGYIKGMALAYAVIYERFKNGDAEVKEMAEGVVKNRRDAIWRVFQEEMNPGLDVLRRLFLIMIGLGMRESSGEYNEGRDMSADNTTADTAESGLFQQSWNSHFVSGQIENMIEKYSENPDTGLWEVFREGVRPKTLRPYGTQGTRGEQFQRIVIMCPLFAVEAAAICLRRLCTHFGPVVRGEVEIVEDAENLLRWIESIVDSEKAVQVIVADTE